MRNSVRALVVAFAATTLAAALDGGTAQAKGEGTAVIRGPGLSSPIVLEGRDGFGWFESTGIMELKWNQPNVDGTPRPDLDLGSAYPAELTLPECGDVVHQTLYPWAEGGPQAYTNKGQRYCGYRLKGGYFPVNDPLIPFLREHGFPAEDPETAPEAVKAEVAAVGSGGGPNLPVIGLLLAIGLAGVLAVGRAVRRPAVEA